MAKRITGEIRLQIPAGQANPAPPVGPALGQAGINIMEFCKQFNTATQQNPGMIVPVVITVYHDRSFIFVTKSSPASVLIKKAAGLAAGAHEPGRETVGQITEKQICEIAQVKKEDLNARDEAQAAKIIAGTARSMGISIVDG